MARLVNQLPRMRVLVVDEDDSLRCVVRDLLIEIGCEVSFVACDVAVRIARDRSPDLDLILLDLDPSAVLGVRDRLAAVLPRMPIAWVSDGNYESTVETAFAVLAAARRHRAKSEERTTARIRRLERTNDDLKRIVQMAGWQPQYIDLNPSEERLAETVMKLEREVFEKKRPKSLGNRDVFVRIGPPIDLGRYVSPYGKDPSAVSHKIAEELRDSIQSFIEEL